MQHKVRRINREADDFLLAHPPNDIDKIRLEKISNTLISPWSLREEIKLRDVWKEEYPSQQAKSLALIEAVENSGIEPYQPPERFPKIEKEEVKLICWIAITASSN